MSLVNEMLRDLEERVKPIDSGRTWQRKVLAASNPIYDYRFLIALAVLILTVGWGVVNTWLSDDSVSDVFQVSSWLNESANRVALPLEIPVHSGDKETDIREKVTTASSGGSAAEKLKTKLSVSVAKMTALDVKQSASAISASPEKPVLENELDSASECCQPSECDGQLGTKSESDCFSDSKNAKPEPVTEVVLNENIPPVAKTIKLLSATQRSEVLFFKAYELAARNRLGAAQSKLEAALELNPDNERAVILLAQVYMRKSRDSLAASLLDKALEERPDNAQFAEQRAKLYLKQNDPELAEKTLKRGLKNAGDDSDYYAFLAALYQQKERHKHAVDLYRRALLIRPGESKWWVGLAISLEASDLVRESLQAYKRASLDRNLPEEMLGYIQQRIAALAAHDRLVKDSIS